MARSVARVLVEIPLVVILCRPELPRRDDLGDDRPVEVTLRLGDRLARRRFLLGVVEEDRRPVLVAVIWTLAVESRRVVHVPERVQELVVSDLRGIVGDLHRLGMTGPPAADLLIGGVVASAARVS